LCSFLALATFSSDFNFFVVASAAAFFGAAFYTNTSNTFNYNLSKILSDRFSFVSFSSFFFENDNFIFKCCNTLASTEAPSIAN
jgi:hypothetical protein